MLVLRNCSFIEALTEGTSLKKGDVLIKDDIIAEIKNCGYKFEGEYEEMDINGGTLMPGIIDMHVHLYYTRGSQAESLLVSPANLAFDCLKYAQFLLSIGVTTVRDVGDDRGRPATALKNAINAGVVVGPRIVDSGLTLCPTEIGMELFANIIESVDGAAEMRKAVRLNFQKGAQFIKLYGTGSMMCEGSEPGIRIMEEDEIVEAVTIAKSKGSYTAIHAHGTEAIDLAVKSGVRTIEHASFIGDETLKYMDGRTDVGIVPTLAVMRDLIENTSEELDFSFVIDKIKRVISNIVSALKNASKYNILIGWGTDQQLGAYEKMPGIEFKLRKEELDYSNIEILKQATINSAKLMMMDDIIGSVKEGKCADLIVINGNPESDISLMYTPPAHVFKSGKLIR